MTDDSRLKTLQAAGSAQSASSARARREDPLAELARLIGQEDPFAEFAAHRPASPGGRARRQQDTSLRAERAAELRRVPEAATVFDAGVLENGHGGSDQGNGRGSVATYAYGGSRRPRSAEQAARREPPAAAPAPADFDFEDDQDYEPEFIPGEGYRYEDDSRSARHDWDEAEAEYADEQHQDEERYAEGDYDPEYDDDAYLPAHVDEFYDEVSRRRVKNWMVIGAAVVGIVVVGISGVFAYRALFGIEPGGSTPRTIRSDTTPSKIVPSEPTQTADAQGNKQIYDRLGEQSASSERILPREETPIIARATEQAPQGTGTPVVTGSSQFAPQQMAPQQNAAMVTPPPAAATEPRRVRTVTVRADGTIVNDPSREATGSTSQAGLPGQTNDGPMSLSAYSGQPPSGNSPIAAPPPRPASDAAPAVPGRVSENPWATPAPTAQAALPQPAPAVAVQTPPPAGSYVVQVASQKSEADAQNSWLALQQRYAQVLGGQAASIRRVDLGERGVFYRAQVGPFASRSQASEICQSLRAAGGECVIQRN